MECKCNAISAMCQHWLDLGSTLCRLLRSNISLDSSLHKCEHSDLIGSGRFQRCIQKILIGSTLALHTLNSIIPIPVLVKQYRLGR